MADKDKAMSKEDLQRLLEENEVSPEFIAQVFANPDYLQAFLEMDAQTLEIQIAALPKAEGASTPYEDVLSQYPDLVDAYQANATGNQSPTAPFSTLEPLGVPAFPVTGPKTGAVAFPNGVIADPSTGLVQFPTAAADKPEDIVGSPQWLIKIQKTWSEKKVAEWRKRLAEMGYQVMPKGEMAQDLLSALSQYHKDRYLNGGTPLPAVPGGGKEAFKEQFDRAEARMSIRNLLIRTTGDYSEGEVDQLEEWFYREGPRLLKKGKTPDQITAHLEEKVVLDPEVQRIQDQDEERTDLRDGLLASIQAINQVGR